jgi:hypothetical protein
MPYKDQNVQALSAIWRNMIRRCHNPESHDYPRYGGRGIKVCEAWRNSFQRFCEDIGPRPSAEHSVDRYPNNDGDYEPGNCRWATRKEQAANRDWPNDAWRATRPAVLKRANAARIAKFTAETHCKFGHEFTVENTYTQSNGCRGCRTCQKRRQREFYLRTKQANAAR